MRTDLYWFKSSYSSEQQGDCIEIAFAWTKSSYSGPQGGDCVEVAACPHAVHVRDSKDTALPSFSVSPAAWAAFLHGQRDPA
ncbi:DUF397 domain-containing protein [Streptomyces roseicoloratus]|uniref:DUF397 domain-containing protein n=1 Tax=Streptomyces roseicoloratus TaxID=2508722 RepID=A0ABY9RU04_9ACTN|nr:DUF397 domain-containing protein [Streptomyces roseicoloratus]WMX45672.1 DUF397 domain-containing protein [Streptomyces roseicoloratus]